jgi:predicted DNA binding CopG/RHH family protein
MPTAADRTIAPISIRMKPINNWSEIPEFVDEAAEARFWENHELDGRLMAASIHEADSRDSTTITLRFDPRMLSRLKRIARSRFLNYQSMMKQWLAERLEEEIRKQ